MILDIVTNHDDWNMVYLDGNIKHSGHDIPWFVWAELVTQSITEVRRWTSDFSLYPPDKMDFSDPQAINIKLLKLKLETDD